MKAVFPGVEKSLYLLKQQQQQQHYYLPWDLFIVTYFL